MSGIYLARTNQKLNFARLHIEALRGAVDSTGWNKHALIESYNESVLFHLVSAYDAFLREVAELYRLDTEHLQGYRSLVQELEHSGQESPEISEIVKLENDDISWLHKLLAAYEACWHGSDKRQQVTETSSVSEIHVLQVNPDHAEDVDIIAELEGWLVSLRELVERLRNNMQEW
ncbi:DUF6586 family protein [Marinobacterium jannaschii]|uniref:DUF6586 family protein n=1 Tax=Marinobacterium jannaschii TaxID=64970 RepID=UPI0004848857|nr:DUF6586 family protein [Marinobacterium jannaschii]